MAEMLDTWHALIQDASAPAQEIQALKDEIVVLGEEMNQDLA